MAGNRSHIRLSVVCMVALLLVVTSAGCGRPYPFTQAPPALPASYYGAIATTPDDLITAYYGRFGNAGNPVLADNNYLNRPIVFHDIIIDERMLLDRAQGFIDVSTVRCLAATSSELAALKDGETVDIVGVNQGMMAGKPGWLSLANCYILTAGFDAVPVSGGTQFSPGY